MQRTAIHDNRDAVIETRVSLAHEYIYVTPGLAHFCANQMAEDCWGEIEIYVADTSAPLVPVRQNLPNIPEDADIAF